MGIFSDDFAAVDGREKLCYHSLTEKANSEGFIMGAESGCRNNLSHKSIRTPTFRRGSYYSLVELLTGLEPVTSSLPRSRAKTRRRKNIPIHLRKVFAINHNM